MFESLFVCKYKHTGFDSQTSLCKTRTLIYNRKKRHILKKNSDRQKSPKNIFTFYRTIYIYILNLIIIDLYFNFFFHFNFKSPFSILANKKIIYTLLHKLNKTT